MDKRDAIGKSQLATEFDIINQRTKDEQASKEKANKRLRSTLGDMAQKQDYVSLISYDTFIY
jgi:hypothetical protein